MSPNSERKRLKWISIVLPCSLWISIRHCMGEELSVQCPLLFAREMLTWGKRNSFSLRQILHFVWPWTASLSHYNKQLTLKWWGNSHLQQRCHMITKSHLSGFFFGLVYLISLTNKGASICSWSIWGHSVYIQVALIINLTHTKLSVSGILFLFFVSCLTVSFRMQFATFLEMCYKLFKLTRPPFFPLLYACFPPPQSLRSNIATECLQS